MKILREVKNNSWTFIYAIKNVKDLLLIVCLSVCGIVMEKIMVIINSSTVSKN